MNPSIRSLLLSLVLAFLAGPVLAATDARTAEMLMRRSGLWDQLASVGPQIRLGFGDALTQSGGRATDTELARLGSSVDAAYGSARMRDVGLALFVRQTDDRHLPALRRWLDSPLGQSIVRLEEVAARREAEPQDALRDGAALLDAMSDARRSILRALVTASRAAESMTDLTINLGAAIHRGVASVAPTTAALGQPDFAEQLRQQRPHMLKAFSALSLASAAKTYQSLDTRDLRRYLAFVRSPAGQHLNDLANRAFDAAMVDGSHAFGRSLPASRDITNS